MRTLLPSLRLLIAGVLLASASQAGASGYTFTDLGGGYSTSATDINNLGQVVGVAVASQFGAHHATLWNDTNATDLGTLGGSNSAAYAINDAGQVAGWSETTPGSAYTRATLWNGATVTVLGTLHENNDAAYAINDAGKVAGSGNIAGGGHAILWDGGATATRLPSPANEHYSGALAINNADQVAGSIQTTSGPTRATVWTSTTITTLGTLGGSNSAAYAINDAGQVAGWSATTGDATHATLWNGTTATDLGTLAGGVRSWANAINKDGIVVGDSSTARGSFDLHATIWIGTTATDLNSLLDASTVSAGWVLIDATDINDHGWIVGNAQNSITHVSRAFVLSPVPEADTYAMMLSGLVLTGFAARRRKSA
jgi:probable HAF family extracellular repeat protein